MTEKVFRIDPDGNVITVYSDDSQPIMAALGEFAVSRASHVEPDGAGWTADLSPVSGPVLGPFPTRAEALASEVDWLYTHVV